jgi:thioredoxin reductase
MKLPVAIIGAGPVGLAAAAHLVSSGESFVLFEAGAEVGASILTWSHVRLFSPWEFNIDQAARQLLTQNGWNAPKDSDIPTGAQLVNSYLRPLAELLQIKPHIQLGAKVAAVSRKGLNKVKTEGRDNLPFVLHIEKNNERYVVEARAVIDASGTWLTPNPMVSEGVWTADERSLNERIFYGIPDILGKHNHRFSGKKVVVAGSGHSAINSLLELAQLKDQFEDTEIVWILRKSQLQEVYGGREKDDLPARGELGTRIQQLVQTGKIQMMTPYHIQQFRKTGDKIEITGTVHGETVQLHGIDEMISNTGSRPDLSFISEVRVSIDHSLESVTQLAPLIDPNIHSCGTVRPHGEKELRQPEKDFYIAGSKSYGRAPTFLMATGYEQVRSIVAHLTGDHEAAQRVELNLPETGVCSAGTTECCGRVAVTFSKTTTKSSCCN